MSTFSNNQSIDVFVSGLPGHVDKNMLQEFASNYNCVGAKILFKSNNNSSSKNGFVTFASIESAKYFISTFNGTDPFTCGIKFVARFADGKNGEQRKIHFGGLNPEVTESDIFTLAAPYGQILNTNRLFEKACCFVTFSTGAEASAAVAGLRHQGFAVSLAKGGKKSASSSNSSSPSQDRLSVGSTQPRASACTNLSVASTEPRSSACSTISMMSRVSMPIDSFMPVNQTIDEFGNIYTIFQQMPMMTMPIMMPVDNNNVTPVMSPVMFQ